MGNRKTSREFLYSEDAAKICTKIMKISKIKYRKILKNNSMMNMERKILLEIYQKNFKSCQL